VVHCTHGKDRTGLMSALLLLMCGVEQDAVVQDYVQSEANLKEDRDRMQDNAGIGATLVRNDVIASPSSTMRELLDYLHAKYGDIGGYLKAIKLPDEQQRAIRKNLLQPEALEQFCHAANKATALSGSKQQQQQQQQHNGSIPAIR
jgi:protein tyrosine/serine phosphatase